MIVLITGATSGFGMACAELFSKKGYKHYIHIDMFIHSYAKKETRKKLEWKDGGNIY